MADNRWQNEDPYRPRRYGQDVEYERDLWRDRDERRGDYRSSRENTSLPIFGTDYGGGRHDEPRGWFDEDRSWHSRGGDYERGLGEQRQGRYASRGEFGRGGYGRGEYGGRSGFGRESGSAFGGDDYTGPGVRGAGIRGGGFSGGGYGPYGGGWERGGERYGGGEGRYGGSRYGESRYGLGRYGEGQYGGGRYGGTESGGQYEGYGEGRFGRGDYGRGSPPGERGWWERTKDEVRSWMGDPDAERRRQMDHRGRGPKSYTRSDDRIREDINDRLTDDPWVDATDIEVTVSAGEVTLSGTVDDRESKRRAEDIAAEVSGVKDVRNSIRVRRMGMGTTGTGTGADVTGGATTPATTTSSDGGKQSGTQTTPRH